MRKAIRAAAKYIHTTLVLAIIAPDIYAMGLRAENYDAGRLYALALLVLFPALACGIAVKKCKSLLSYLLLGVAAALATLFFALRCAQALLGDLAWGYVLLLAAEIVWVLLEQLMERMSIDKNAKKVEGYSADQEPRDGIFERPRYGALALFVVSYALGLAFSNPALCDQALASAAVYLIVAMLYDYVARTERYLSLHGRVKNLPSKRIYGIGGGLMLAVLAAVAAVSAASAATAGLRAYTDVREWSIFSDFYYEQPSQQQEEEKADLSELFQEEIGETKPLPKWVDALLWLIAGAAVLGCFFGLLCWIRAFFKRFRENFEENGDIVEELSDCAEDAARLPRGRHMPRPRSRRERVRYQYRRFIRRHRREKPDVAETPSEIETLAGVAGSEEGREMHLLYERARYGREEEG